MVRGISEMKLLFIMETMRARGAERVTSILIEQLSKLSHDSSFKRISVGIFVAISKIADTSRRSLLSHTITPVLLRSLQAFYNLLFLLRSKAIHQ